MCVQIRTRFPPPPFSSYSNAFFSLSLFLFFQFPSIKVVAALIGFALLRAELGTQSTHSAEQNVKDVLNNDGLSSSFFVCWWGVRQSPSLYAVLRGLVKCVGTSVEVGRDAAGCIPNLYLLPAGWMQWLKGGGLFV